MPVKFQDYFVNSPAGYERWKIQTIQHVSDGLSGERGIFEIRLTSPLIIHYTDICQSKHT